MKKRVADIIVDTLKGCGVTTCFSVVGGGAMHLNNAFALQGDDIKTIYCHHEQACSMAAEGFARYSGCLAAVCVTSGPGGINAINGVQSAWVDSIPMIVLSGAPRYSTTVPPTGLKIRSRGVQENNIISMVSGITKYAKQILDPLTVRAEIQFAISLAMEGRRGPVWLEIPLDVQGALVDVDSLTSFDISQNKNKNTEIYNNIYLMVKEIHKSTRPCILTGSAIRSSNVKKEYDEFTTKVRVPIVGGALRADINARGDKLYYGMSGAIGPRIGNFILQSADFILVLGNSLSTTQTGFNQEMFAPNATIVCVDVSEDEMKKPGLRIDIPIKADLRNFFIACNDCHFDYDAPIEWINHCDMVYSSFAPYEMLEYHKEVSENDRIPMLLFWKEFMSSIDVDDVVALGNSDSCIGVLQEGISKNGQRVIVNYNCGSMGDDLPPAIGAAIASNQTVYCVTGDGSIMLNIQELETIVYHGFPIKIVIMNNGGYGTIRNTCKSFFGGLYAGCNPQSGLGFPDFQKISDAFCIPYHKCETIQDLNSGINWLVEQDGCCILEIFELYNDFIGPSIESIMDENGCFSTPPLHIMTPLLSDEDLSKYMLL